MGIIHRTKKRLLLVLTAKLPDRAGCEQLPVKPVAVFKSARSHSFRGTNRRSRILRKWNVERPKLVAEKSGGGERLQLFAFSKIKAAGRC